VEIEKDRVANEAFFSAAFVTGGHKYTWRIVSAGEHMCYQPVEAEMEDADFPAISEWIRLTLSSVQACVSSSVIVRPCQWAAWTRWRNNSKWTAWSTQPVW